MSGPQRAVVLAVAVVVLVVAFVALSGGDDEGDDTTARTAPVQQQSTAATSASTAPKPAQVPTIRVRDGKPVGGIQKITVDQGDRLRFQVTSPDSSGEIHFHGYDLERDLEAEGSVLFSIKARITGIFEVELEDTGVQIASVRVNR